MTEPPPSNETDRQSLAMFVPGVRSEDDQASLVGMLARYTRFVIFSKWFLGVFALTLLGALIIWPLLQAEEGTRISLTSDTNTSSSNFPTMYNPRYQGTDGQSRQYVVTAQKAVQQSKEVVQLALVSGEMFFANGSWASLKASEGIFDERTQLLELRGAVTVSHTEGYTIITDQAFFKVKEGSGWGEQAVSASGPAGKLLATGFEIMDNGNILRFGKQGRVQVTIDRKPS